MDEDLLFKIIVILLGLITSVLTWIGVRMIGRLDKFIDAVTENQLTWSEKHHDHDKRISKLDYVIQDRIKKQRDHDGN